MGPGTGPLYLGYGKYTVGAETRYSYGSYALSGDASLSSGTEYIGYDGVGAMQQSGGTNTVNTLSLGHASGTGTYELTDGNLSARTEYVGYGGTGSFVQQGGRNATTDGLYIGYGVRVPGPPLLGYTEGVGTYLLEGGELSTANEYVGYGLLAHGEFVQSGGTNTITGTLTVGPTVAGTGAGRYSLSGGALNTFNLNITSYGTFNITDSAASITVAGNMTIANGAVFSAVPGTIIHMTGATFNNQSTSEADLSGLENALLIFEGSLNVVDLLEIAGTDFGAVLDGFDGNFSLGGLEIGGARAGYVRLIDNYNNGNRGGVGGDAEAIYVKHLVIRAWSTLDLNGYHIYVEDYEYEGNATVLNGTITAWNTTLIPEPVTLALIAPALMGLAGVMRRRLLGK